MTFENSHKEHIYAFAFGCLDIEKQKELFAYQKQNPNFNWNELGEYQNLAALLPSILTIENPDNKLKDAVARRLYSLRNEIKKTRETIEQTKAETQSKDVIRQKNDKTIEVEKEGTLVNNEITKTGAFQVVTPERKTKEYFTQENETQIKGRNIKSFLKDKEVKQTDETKTNIKKTETKPAIEEKIETKEKTTFAERQIKRKSTSTKKPITATRTYVTEKKSNLNPLLYLMLLLVIAGLIYAYFVTQSKIKYLSNNVDRLTYQISSLTASLNLNRQLQNVLSSKNVSIINMSGTSFSKGGNGKLIISFDQNKGFLQLFNMPSLEKNKSYQLWVNISKSYYSLGVYTPSGNTKYYSFKLPQLRSKYTIRFLVTKELKIGAERPSKQVYLKGKL